MRRPVMDIVYCADCYEERCEGCAVLSRRTREEYGEESGEEYGEEYEEEAYTGAGHEMDREADGNEEDWDGDEETLDWDGDGNG